MNFENVNILSQKIEGVLGTVRTLKEENAKIKAALVTAKNALQDKTLLLDTANQNLQASHAELVDAKAALEARANQVAAQDETLNQLQTANAQLNEQVASKTAEVEQLTAQVAELSSKTESLNGQFNDKLVSLANMTEQLAAKETALAEANDKLAQATELLVEAKNQLEEKSATIENLNAQLQAQADEIADAQEKFQQLVSTIETELGTELPIEQSDVVMEAVAEESVLEDASEEVVEETANEETAADVAEEFAEEEVPAEPEIVAVEDMDSQAAEDDLPTIEVHGANEKNQDNDLFASNKEGSQTSFFRLNWLMDEDPFGVGSR